MRAESKGTLKEERELHAKQAPEPARTTGRAASSTRSLRN